MPISAEGLAQIARTAEGNPLFLEQILALLTEEGRSADEVTLPPTIRAVLASRLDRLGPGERAVLERASVIGREFSLDGVLALLPTDARTSVPRHLDALVRKELVRAERPGSPEPADFGFGHVLIQEAAYRAVPKGRRAELHEHFAEWLEGHVAAEIAAYAEIVGYHFERAFRYREELRAVDAHAHRVAERGAEHLASAGHRARLREDLPSAAGLLGRATELLDPGDRRRLELLPELIETLREAVELERASAYVHEAIEGAVAAGDVRVEMRARVEGAYLRLMTDRKGAVDNALDAAERALVTFEGLGDPLGLAKACQLKALALRLRGRQSERRVVLEEGIAHARRAGDVRIEAALRDVLGGVFNSGPASAEEIIEYARENLEITRPIGSRSNQADALAHGFGRPYAMLGRFDEARAFVAQARAIAEDLGLVWNTAGLASAAGFVELLAGDPVAAERELRAGLDVLERAGMTGSYFGHALRDELAQALYEQGRYGEAKELSEASERSAPADDVQAQVQWRSVRAKVTAREGRLDAAEAIAREALVLVQETELVLVHANAVRDLAEVLTLAGRPDEAFQCLEEAERLYERKGDRVSASRARLAAAALAPERATG